MLDPRVEKLAHNLVNYSLKVKKGEKVLIEAFETDSAITTQLMKKVFEVGGQPFVVIRDAKVQRAAVALGDDEYFKNLCKYDIYRMQDMDCYIGVRGSLNSYESSDVPAAKSERYSVLYSPPGRPETRVCETRWVVLR